MLSIITEVSSGSNRRAEFHDPEYSVDSWFYSEGIL